jgi:excisionase family DNA binding protein
MTQIETFRWTTVPKFLERHKELVSKNTLHSWIKDGAVPHIRIGRKILVREDALDLMLQGAGGRNG